jgi:hypothetical protein
VTPFGASGPPERQESITNQTQSPQLTTISLKAPIDDSTITGTHANPDMHP